MELEVTVCRRGPMLSPLVVLRIIPFVPAAHPWVELIISIDITRSIP